MNRLNALVGSAVVAGLIGVGSQVEASPPAGAAGDQEVRSIAAVTLGTLEGVVTDESGGPVGGAMVSALGPTSALAVADVAGRFALRALPPGAYLVRAHLIGYSPSRRQFIEVRASARATVSMEIRRTDAVRVLAAGMAPPPPPPVAREIPQPEDVIGQAGSMSEGAEEVAWRLRHLKRSVLKESTDRVGLRNARFETDGPLGGFLPEGFAAVARAVGSSARFASTLFGDLPLTGEFNVLTTGSFDNAQDDGLTAARGVAYLSLTGPAGRADWAVRAVMTQGQTGSWFLSGSYGARNPTTHLYDVGFSYSVQRYVAGRGDLGTRTAEGVRSAGAIYASNSWRLSPDTTLWVGSRYHRYDYIPGASLFSPRITLSLAPTDSPYRLTTTVSQRDLAPGAEEFLPPLAAGLWVPPGRSFAPISSDERFPIERTRHYEVALERDLQAGHTVTVRGFYQSVDAQLATLFDASSDVGHYLVGASGDVDARGVSVGVSNALGSRFRGTVAYQYTDASWQPATDTLAIRQLVPSAARHGREQFHNLVTSVETEIPATDTRLVVHYRIDTAYARPMRNGEAGESSEMSGRFDVQITQPLPFMNFTAARWQLLVAVRSLFRDPAQYGSVYDELLVVRPPKRVVGGMLVRF